MMSPTQNSDSRPSEPLLFTLSRIVLTKEQINNQTPTPQPLAKLLLHRFDKGSYVYLFEDVDQRRARIEIANHPGTEDQDAFDGCESLSSHLARPRANVELQTLTPPI